MLAVGQQISTDVPELGPSGVACASQISMHFERTNALVMYKCTICKEICTIGTLLNHLFSVLCTIKSCIN
jgi:hypothetical protein